MSERVVVHIDLAALLHNFNVIKHLTQSKIMTMIKGNAYGHGAISVAKILQDSDAFGVAEINEALELRVAGITQRIVVMLGILSLSELELYAEQSIESVVHSEYQVELLENATLASPITVWLKIDTGMHRLGFPLEHVEQIYQRLQRCASVKEIHFISHLASADNIENPITASQIKYFTEATQFNRNAEKTLANSAGILAWPEAHFDWVRPGIMLYGISPMQQKVGASHHLLPVMTLQSKLIAIHFLKKGEYVGYGSTWQCDENMPVGIVAIGYADGYPRHAKTGTPVIVNDKVCPIVGRVSMDFIAIDLRACPKAKVNDKVILWGDGLPAEKVAEQVGTIGYELTTRISPRAPVFYRKI